MQITITPASERAPRHKLAEAQIEFGPEDGVLDGCVLTGFDLWVARDTSHGEIMVTVPGRPYKGRDEKPKTYNYLRGRQSIADVDGLKRAIIEAFHAAQI